MKYWVGVTLVLSLLVASSQQTDAQARDTNLGPDANFKCPAGASIAPHPERCDQYYTCYGGQDVYLWQCRDNLLYDLVYSGCNWPDQTYCGNRTVPGATTMAPYWCSQDGFFPADSSQCIQKYYTCLDGTAYVTACPSYGVFEPTRKICVAPGSSSCKAVEPTTTTTRPITTPSTVPTTTPTYPPCTNKFTCVYPTSTTTENTTPRTTPKPDVTSPSSPGEFACPSSNGSYPDPVNCSNYYTCDNWVAYRFTCPGGLVFNPTSKVCDWPANVPGC